MNALTTRFLDPLRLALGLGLGRAPAVDDDRDALRLDAQGRYAEAAEAARRSVERRRRTLGDRHPDVATALNNLGMLLHKAGDLDQAEPLLRESLDVRREALGERDPAYASALNNLGLVLLDRGDLDAAEPLLTRALEIRRDASGGRDSDAASSLCSLAALRQRQGDSTAAESLLRESLEIRRESLGERDPAYASALNNLGLVLLDRGDLDAAEPLLRQALEVRRDALGESHPDVASSIDDLDALHRRRVETPDAALPEPRDLLAESSALAEVFAAVGREMAEASRAIQEEGAPPADELIARQVWCRREYDRLRGLAIRTADARAVEFEGAEGLAALSRWVDRLDSGRRETAAALDRVARLSARGGAEAPGLVECRAGALAGADAAPYLALLALIDGPDDLDDDEWSALYDAVADRFGRPLAAAAARGGLTVVG